MEFVTADRPYNPRIEMLRDQVFERIFSVASFTQAWPVWRKAIATHTSDFSDPKAVYTLGSELSRIFKLTGEAGRGQGSLSGGGAGWECLVTWYLNAVLSGSNAFATRQLKDLVPPVIRNALTVKYGTITTNTESDILVLGFPEEIKFDNLENDKKKTKFFDECENYVHGIDVLNIQCKTNWNDNAQIPMLWDMVYKSKGFKENNLSIGMNGVSISNLRSFRYSFVTVPSQSEQNIPKPNSAPVNRVQNLSGKNFWGRKTQAGVALSISEIFTENTSEYIRGSVQRHTQYAIEEKIGWFRLASTF